MFDVASHKSPPGLAFIGAGIGVRIPIGAPFTAKVNIFTPTYLLTQWCKLGKLNGFERGAAPRAQIR